MSEEWFEIKCHRGGNVDGYIPRSVVESLGVDCSPMDRGAAIFFTATQSQAMREHPRWDAVRENQP